MNSDEVCRREQLFFADIGRSGCFGAIPSQVLTPCQDFHIESQADSRHRSADAPQTHDPERLSAQARADGVLPPSLAQVGLFARDVARHRQNQGPGELGGAGAATLRARDGNA